MPRTVVAISLVLAMGAAAGAAGSALHHTVQGGAPIVIGAVYPTGGGQGPGGTEEFRGAAMAAEYANRAGGWQGRPIELRLEHADSWDAAPFAVERLANRGIAVVVGSYGSTISRPAAEMASRLGLVFWETGAVGQLGMAASSPLVFRFAPTGESLGRAAVAFVREQLAPRLRVRRNLRYTVAYVDDVYGRAVAGGAQEEIRTSGLILAAALPYALPGVDYVELAGQIAQARTDVLVVAAYLDDAVAMRRAGPVSICPAHRADADTRGGGAGRRADPAATRRASQRERAVLCAVRTFRCRSQSQRHERHLGVGPPEDAGGSLAARVFHASHRRSIAHRDVRAEGADQSVSRRALAWGVAAALLYVITAVLVSRVMPVRFLY